MRNLSPRRRDPAQATPERCYGCHRAIPICGKAFPRQVRGASNRMHTVYLCQTCALSEPNPTHEEGEARA